jgi:ABC-2 type transport system ATP-binding protein
VITSWFRTSAPPVFDDSAPVVLQHVTKRFGTTVALDQFDLTMSPGRVTALVGPDGAGKSTTLRLLAGALRPSSGRLLIGGLDVVGHTSAVQARLGFVPSRRLLYGDLTVEENLKFFAGLYPADPDAMVRRRGELLELVDLARFTTRLAGNLSGGMRQKLALACALQHGPAVLLMDEPTTGIDPLARRDLWRLFHRLNRDGLTIVLATPAMDEATRSHEVVFMAAGKVVARGTPDSLLAHAEGRVVAFEATPMSEAAVVARRLPGVESVQPRGDRLHLLLDSTRAAAPASVADAIRATGVVVRSHTPVAPTLEDVYVALTTTSVASSLQVTGGVTPPLGGLTSATGVNGDAGRLGLTPRHPSAPGRILDTPKFAEEALAIQTRGITRRFGDFVAVNRLSITVKRGTIFGLLGPNGSGKTTMIRMLCGVLDATEGSARVMGCELPRDSVALKPRIGYMSQKAGIYDEMTVREHLRFYAGLYDIPRAQRSDAEARVLSRASTLLEWIDTVAGSIPVGSRQDLAFACATIHAPPLLFLDEPTADMAPVQRRAFWDSLYQLADQGTTILVTTHYLDEAVYCHDLALMHRSNLVAAGTPDALMDGLANPLVEVACPAPHAALELLDDLEGVTETALYGDTLHVLLAPGIASDDAVHRVRTRLVGAGVPVTRVGPVRPTLDDVFAAVAGSTAVQG